MVSEVVDDLIVDVVLDLQEAVGVRVCPGHGVIPDVLADLYLARVGVEIALGVEVEVGDVVAEVVEDVLAVAWATGIRGPHVGREEAQDGVQSDLVPDHLVRELRVCQLGGVLVRPGVAGNLMAFSMHPSDDGRVDG